MSMQSIPQFLFGKVFVLGQPLVLTLDTKQILPQLVDFMLAILAQGLLLFKTLLLEGLELILQVLDIRGMPLLS
jgi:hypothetical protein